MIPRRTLTLTATAGDDDKATVSVFHGVPGLTADLYADGKELLSDFEPGTLTQPRALDPGTYGIQIHEARRGPDGTPAVEKRIEVRAGADATLAAHLCADGRPQLTAFVDDVSEVDAGEARLTSGNQAAPPAGSHAAAVVAVNSLEPVPAWAAADAVTPSVLVAHRVAGRHG